jgi:hypothetical protein
MYIIDIDMNLIPSMSLAKYAIITISSNKKSLFNSH